ncbi:MAG: ABC-F type ribosomal protection protein [Oscillospiraceae bacterium]|nr:ABC-F type ribosomal protection protein [Oscillospiraceae bacterium]
MAQISVNNLTFCYDGSYDNIFENVSFNIDTSWKLGFCGRNGRGKTTFMKLLMGEYEYSGSISASVDFEYFPTAVDDPSRLTIEVVDGDYPQWELYRELSLLAVDEEVLYRPFETLSNGEQTKVLLASLFLRENSFLLIDEPTNHLDMEARAIVAKYLNGKSGFILVSHDRAFLDACTDHTLSINKTNIEVVSGSFSSWYYNKQLQDNYELAENERLKKDIRRLGAAAREKAAWSDKVEKSKVGAYDKGYVGHQAAKMMKRSKSIESRQNAAIQEKEKLLKNIEEAENLKLHPLQFHSRRLAELDRVSISYGDKTVCENLSFVIEQGDRIALRGRNGCGKSSVIKLICGENTATSGDVFVAKGLTISYVQQDASKLSGPLSRFEEESGIDVSLFRAILRKLDFSRVQFEKDIGSYSAGQKKKLLIARSLCRQAHLYIWDEPLNYIDILSRMQIEELIKEYEPTLLFVEHDRVFCDNIATKIVEM